MTETSEEKLSANSRQINVAREETQPQSRTRAVRLRDEKRDLTNLALKIGRLSIYQYIVGNNLDEIVFSNAVREGNLQKDFEKIIQEPIKQTIHILQRLIEQRNDVDPDGKRVANMTMIIWFNCRIVVALICGSRHCIGHRAWAEEWFLSLSL